MVNLFFFPLFLSSFNPLYLIEIQHILNLIACANHLTVFQKKPQMNSYESFIVYIYIFSSLVILIIHPSLFKQYF